MGSLELDIDYVYFQTPKMTIMSISKPSEMFHDFFQPCHFGCKKIVCPYPYVYFKTFFLGVSHQFCLLCLKRKQGLWLLKGLKTSNHSFVYPFWSFTVTEMSLDDITIIHFISIYESKDESWQTYAPMLSF